MLCPNLLIVAMYECQPGEFLRRLCGNDFENIKRFWTSQEQHPMFADHPMHEDTEHNKKYPFRKFGIPIRFHGDGVTSVARGKIWARSVEAWSWPSCLVKPGVASWVDSFIIMMVFEQLIAAAGDGGDTFDALWKELDWGLYWAYLGMHPDRDSCNNKYTSGILFDRALTPLAGGFRLIMWIVRADLDFIVKRFKQGNYRKGQCFTCGANTTDVPWTDCNDGPVWLPAVWNETTWKLQFPRRHRFFRHVPGAGVALYVADPLHVKYIGTDAYYNGSVLYLLIHVMLPGSVADNLAQVIEEMKQEYKTQGVQRDKMPLLKGTSIKGAKAKLPYLKSTGKEMKHMTKGVVAHFSKTHGAKMCLCGGKPATSMCCLCAPKSCRRPAAQSQD